MKEREGKVTINDVAKKAGVGKATVSRVINNADGVSSRTRQTVLTAIKDMGFTPSISARSLATNETKQIALAFSDIRNPHFPEVVWAAEQVAKKYGYRIIQINTYGNPREELEVVRQASQMHIDGMVFLPLAYPKMLKAVVKNAKIPISLITYGKRLDPEMPADIVYLSPQEGRVVMDHLFRIGRSRIAYAGGPKDYIEERYLAYEMALSENLVRLDPTLIYLGTDFSLQTGLEAADYFAKLSHPPDAIYAANDMIAIGLLHRFKDLGVRVPEDVAVVGIDDIRWCTITTPQLSTVSILGSETARVATELLIQRIKNKKVGAFERIQMEPRLVVRETSIVVNRVGNYLDPR